MAYYSDSHGFMRSPNSGNGNAFQNQQNHFSPYGYSHVVSICHICGIHGHTAAACQQGYSPTQNCFGLNFAQQHGSYHSNYSDGWRENPNVTYRNNSPQFSSFSSSATLQSFGCEENNYYAAQPQYLAQPDVPQQQELFHEEEYSKLEVLQRMQLELWHSLKESVDSFSARLDDFEALQSAVDSEGINNMETPKELSEGVHSDPMEGSEQDQIIVKDIIIQEKDMEEIQVDMPLVIEECDESGLSNPLDDLPPTEFSAITLYSMIPSLNVKLKCDLLKIDNASSVFDIAHTQDNGYHYPQAKILFKDACSNIAHISHVDTYYPDHVLYSYTYIIGYSIDDILGVNPITCASFSLCECNFRISVVHHSSRPAMVRVDIPWDPGGFMAW